MSNTKFSYLTRSDENVGAGSFDSIAWALTEHVKEQDKGEYNYALLHGNEDAPDKIEFWRNEPNYNSAPDRTWNS